MSAGTLLDAYIEAIKRADHQCDRDFHVLFAIGAQLLGFSDNEAANHFNTSLPTIDRWRNGENAPYHLMRKYIYAWLLTKAEELKKEN